MIKAVTGKNLNIPLFTYRDDCKKNEYSKKANNVLGGVFCQNYQPTKFI
jgi:hypothetical protein